MEKIIKTFSDKRLDRWIVEVREQSQTGKLYPVAVNTDTLQVDYPLRLDDGRILYDFPERVPEYAKVFVKMAYRWILSRKEIEQSEKILEVN